MRLFRIPLFLVCFFLVSGIVHAAVSDYSDVFIYNVQESSDLDSVEFDLSEIIPEENRILFKIAVVKGTERVELHEVELGGGKHVKISNLSDTYAINGYGDYTLFVKVCPAEVADYKGSGTESGCGPTKMIQIEYYPWKVESNFIEDDKVIIASIGEKFMVFATGGDIYEGKPTLKVKRLNGEESEAISCVENKFGPKVQWECTVDEGDEETTVLDFWVFDQKVSNSIVLFAQLPEMVELARFASLCEINLLEQNGSRYKYEVVHSNTRERDKLCSSPMVVVEGQGHVIASTDHTFTVEALPSEPFTIIASKGTGPSLVHSENLYDPSVLMESLSCQTLTKQTEGTLTVRRVNGDGKEVTSCYFPNVAVLQSGDRSPPEVLLKERNRIVVDATYLSSFKVVTSATGIKGLIDESFGADTRTLSEGDREYLRENFPGSIEEFEVYPLRGISSLMHQAAEEREFSDVSKIHPNRDAIEYVRSQGIVGGYEDGTFRPENSINRAEFTKIIVASRYSQNIIENCISNPFKDVGKSAWYSHYVCVAKNGDVLDGYEDGSFRPSEKINFAEASKIITNAFNLPLRDIKVQPWFYPYVSTLASRNAIPLDVLGADFNLTRGQMAEIIYRLNNDIRDLSSHSVGSLGLKSDSGLARKGWKRYEDISGIFSVTLPVNWIGISPLDGSSLVFAKLNEEIAYGDPKDLEQWISFEVFTDEVYARHNKTWAEIIAGERINSDLFHLINSDISENWKLYEYTTRPRQIESIAYKVIFDMGDSAVLFQFSNMNAVAKGIVESFTHLRPAS